MRQRTPIKSQERLLPFRRVSRECLRQPIMNSEFIIFNSERTLVPEAAPFGGQGATKKASSISAGGFLRRRRPTLPHCGAVPSARSGLTSLFGMGRGGTPRLKPPKYFVQFIIKNSEFIIILSIYYSLLTTNSSFLIKNRVLIGIDCGKKKRSEPLCSNV